jgi:phospholipid/cholesterol/gamma-HCH transport system permease protein
MKEWNSFIVVVSLVKGYVFSFIMITVSAYQGFYTTGGAIEVGKASTRAVVFSCILILFADYIIAQVML